MIQSITIQPVKAPIRGTVRPPGSKSITNRALVCAALAHGHSVLTGALDSEDTRLMIHALRKLGYSIQSEDVGHSPRDNVQSTPSCPRSPPGRGRGEGEESVDPVSPPALTVTGTGGSVPSLEAELYVGNSGTTIRFLSALVALGHGAFHLDGTDRMRERPIGDLLDALGQLGTLARSDHENGCPPVSIHANGLQGGEAVVRGAISSQFLSGLLLAAPYARDPIHIRIEGTLVSKPYIQMTLGVMRSFGVDVTCSDPLDTFTVPNETGYHGCEYAIEPDASAASYFWAAAAITGGEVTVTGLSDASLQGDVAFCNCLERMGCEILRTKNAMTVRGRPLSGIDVDMNAISDTVQTLATVALFAQSRTRIRNVAHIRHKETDRIKALATELGKFGAAIEEHADGLTIEPGPLHGAEIHTYNDHRMAMSLALAGLVLPDVTLHDPDCTAKTYPRYFQDLHQLVDRSTEEDPAR